jgi:thymidylate kinase
LVAIVRGVTRTVRHIRGGEGPGKSTQVRRLVEALCARRSMIIVQTRASPADRLVAGDPERS